MPTKPILRGEPFERSFGGKLDSLTTVRCFAALLVVCYHVGITPLSNVSSVAGRVAAKGYAAVGLFYVLSGFVLAYNYADRKTTYRNFLVARLARIYPVYVTALLLSLPRFVVHLRNDHVSGATALASIVFVPLLIQSWFPQTALQWNAPAWSLSVEALFYLLFPLLLASFLYVSRRRLQVCLALAWLASLVPSLLYLLSLGQSFTELRHIDLQERIVSQSSPFLYIVNFNPLMRLPEFIGGVILGLLFLRRRGSEQTSRPRWKAEIMLAGVIVVIVAVMAIPNLAPYPLLHNGAFFPLWCLLVYSLACSNLVARSFRLPILLTLGEISYGMYILQQPVSNYVKLALLKTAHISIKGDYPQCFLLLFYMVVLASVSYISFYKMEMPAASWIRKRFSAAKPKVLEQV